MRRTYRPPSLAALATAGSTTTTKANYNQISQHRLAAKSDALHEIGLAPNNDNRTRSGSLEVPLGVDQFQTAEVDQFQSARIRPEVR